MAQHDYFLDNQTGLQFRGDLNNALEAIVTQNSGSNAPNPTFAYQYYVDTDDQLLRQRDGTNSAWLTIAKIGSATYLPDGTTSAPSLAFSSDLPSATTGFYKVAAGSVGLVAADGPTFRLTDLDGDLADGEVSSAIEFYQSDTGGAGIGASIKAVGDGTSGDLALTFSSGANTEAARFNASGWFGINTTDPLQRFHCDGTALFSKDTGTEEVTVRTQTTSTSGSTLVFQKSRGSAASPTTVTDGDTVGRIRFEGYTGSAYETGFEIVCEAKTQTGGTGLENSFIINNGGAERLRIGNLGSLICLGVYDNTVASGDSVSVSSTGQLQRITSSIKYKTSVETLEDSYADALLGCRPVWYRSTCEGDNAEHSFWGFIAEEVAAIDPRLVNFKTVEVTYDDESRAIETPCTPEPESVMYDRFVPHLLNLIKRQKTAIEALEARVAALESP